MPFSIPSRTIGYVPGNSMLRINLRWTSIQSEGKESRNSPSRFMWKKPEIRARSDEPFRSSEDFTITSVPVAPLSARAANRWWAADKMSRETYQLAVYLYMADVFVFSCHSWPVVDSAFIWLMRPIITEASVSIHYFCRHINSHYTQRYCYVWKVLDYRDLF